MNSTYPLGGGEVIDSLQLQPCLTIKGEHTPDVEGAHQAAVPIIFKEHTHTGGGRQQKGTFFYFHTTSLRYINDIVQY